MAVFAMGMAFAGCQSWRTDETPAKVLTIHELTTAAQDTERFVLILPATEDTSEMWLRRIPLLHSRYIEAMEVTRGASGMVALKCHLNQHGRYLWTQISATFAGRTLAVLVDGELSFLWRVPSGGEDFAPFVVLEGPWSREEAAAVAAQARRNHRLLND